MDMHCTSNGESKDPFCAVPVVEREVEEPPPFAVVVHGPPGVGKTTVIKNLIKHYTRQNIGDVKGPITLISGKHRRLTFVECPQVCPKRINHVQNSVLSISCKTCHSGLALKRFECV